MPTKNNIKSRLVDDSIELRGDFGNQEEGISSEMKPDKRLPVISLVQAQEILFFLFERCSYTKEILLVREKVKQYLDTGELDPLSIEEARILNELVAEMSRRKKELPNIYNLKEQLFEFNSEDEQGLIDFFGEKEVALRKNIDNILNKLTFFWEENHDNFRFLGPTIKPSLLLDLLNNLRSSIAWEQSGNLKFESISWTNLKILEKINSLLETIEKMLGKIDLSKIVKHYHSIEKFIADKQVELQEISFRITDLQAQGRLKKIFSRAQSKITALTVVAEELENEIKGYRDLLSKIPQEGETIIKSIVTNLNALATLLDQAKKTPPVVGKKFLGELLPDEDILDCLALVRCADHGFGVKDGKFISQAPCNNPDQLLMRDTVHFNLNEPVVSHFGGNWDNRSIVAIAPFKGVLEKNGVPISFCLQDCWWFDDVEYPDGTVIIVKSTNSELNLPKGLRGKIKIIVSDDPREKSKEILDAMNFTPHIYPAKQLLNYSSYLNFTESNTNHSTWESIAWLGDVYLDSISISPSEMQLDQIFYYCQNITRYFEYFEKEIRSRNLGNRNDMPKMDKRVEEKRIFYLEYLIKFIKNLLTQNKAFLKHNLQPLEEDDFIKLKKDFFNILNIEGYELSDNNIDREKFLVVVWQMLTRIQQELKDNLK